MWAWPAIGIRSSDGGMTAATGGFGRGRARRTSIRQNHRDDRDRGTVLRVQDFTLHFYGDRLITLAVTAQSGRR